jgi:Xaa-Pro aminopeptidase
MAGHLNRHRASLLMREQGLSALVLAQPESITYATGAFAGVASFWRRAGAAFVLIPADEAAPLSAILGDLQAKSFAASSGIADTRSHRIWVETDKFPLDETKLKQSPRPAQFDITQSLNLLRDVITERGLQNTSIGLELGFIPVADFAAFSALPATWVDCTRVVEQLRAVKSDAEIDKLRLAAQYASEGLVTLTRAITPGMTAEQMSQIWREAALASAAARGNPAPQSTWSYIAVGGDGFAPGGPAKSGDIIKIDVGTVIDGYSSDGARTAVLGKPSTEARKTFDALHCAFDAGLALIAPGNKLSDVYFAAARKMWDQGYETYGRGHFGHGVGASIWSEEWPFISADATAIIEPNMVLAFETPWYIDGLGGFIIEDQLLITPTGFEVMAPSDRGLIEV